VLLTNLMDEATRYANAALESPSELFAIVSVLIAGGLMLVSSFVKTMIPLRWLAIGSNFGFVAYGALHPSMPMLLLHATLVPINLYRLAAMVRLTRRVRAVAGSGDLLGIWLRPYMRSAKLSKGTVLFRKGDLGDRMYLLAEGRVDLVEMGTSLMPGDIFGEIAFFSPDRRRGATARCAENCLVLSIDESTLKQLYYQNPAFGFKLIGLVAGRLSADVQRYSAEVQRLTAALNAQNAQTTSGRDQLAARADATD
jgi:CRP/FNR family transcriptional regulator, cyclic AMP receptor protein